MRKIISLICFVMPLVAWADDLTIKDNAPDHYRVVKGDTLWSISSKFFDDPWKWPQIWGLNKDTIKDPHWIYPGDTVYLDAASKTLHIGQLPASASKGDGSSQDVSTDAKTELPLVPGIGFASSDKTEKLYPRARVMRRDEIAIPSVSTADIAPFLKKPLIISEDELEGSPVIAGTLEKRSLISKGDLFYAQKMPVDKGDLWQIYRPGKEFIDPDTDESLGFEANYLGNASVKKYADISTLRVTDSILEIRMGDHLVQPSITTPDNYIPRSPESSIEAKVISVYGGVNQGGKDSVVALNRGKRDGIENGHVLALYHKGEDVVEGDSDLQLPDYRYGLVFVFRTFDKVCYALVVEASMPVQLLDKASTP